MRACALQPLRKKRFDEGLTHGCGFCEFSGQGGSEPLNSEGLGLCDCSKYLRSVDWLRLSFQWS